MARNILIAKKANDILTKARMELKNFIVYEVKHLYKLIMDEEPEDGNYCIESGDLLISLNIEHWVDDYEGNYYAESHLLSTIYVDEDDDVNVGLEEDVEKHWFSLSTDELYEIANALEYTYLNKLGKEL